MKVTRESMFSGEVREMEINITPEQYKRWIEGELIQNVAPHLDGDEREFLISGVTPDEWAEMFDLDDEEE